MNSADFIKRNGWLIAILLLAIFLRLFHLGFQSLWLDEIFTLNISDPQLSSDQFHYEMILREGFPYLYFYVLQFLYAILGYSPETARLLSAIGGIVGVYAVYLVGKEIFSKNAGLIAAFLMAINEYNIQISQDARPYSLYLMATVLSFYRLAIFLRNPNLKNAVWYGLFTALIINFNFFGFVNVLSQVIIIFAFILIGPKNYKISVIKFSALSGAIALLLFAPNYKMLIKLIGFKSFWVPPPAPDSITKLLVEFLGNSEITLFIFATIFLYYIITLFRQKDTLSYEYIITSKFQFSFIIIFGWAAVFIGFLIFKSYTDISLMLPRYFVSLSPVLAIVLGIGICLIQNKFVKYVVIGTIGVFSLMNLVVVKDYYNKVSKTQFREISKEILRKNPENDKIVSSWGWQFNYYMKSTTKRNNIESTLSAYVENMMSQKMDNLSFWYVDANGLPYNLSLEHEAYLNENFVLDQNIEYYDTWAKHYKSKKSSEESSFLTLSRFQPSLFDGRGDMIFIMNSESKYPPLFLAKGDYTLIVRGKSLPSEPLNGVNAHFNVLLDDVKVGEFSLSNLEDNPGNTVPFKVNDSKDVELKIVYDNDEVINEIDRNGVINSIQIKKQ